MRKEADSVALTRITGVNKDYILQHEFENEVSSACASVLQGKAGLRRSQQCRRSQ